jgi:hypothetical protein
MTMRLARGQLLASRPRWFFKFVEHFGSTPFVTRRIRDESA